MISPLLSEHLSGKKNGELKRRRPHFFFAVLLFALLATLALGQDYPEFNGQKASSSSGSDPKGRVLVTDSLDLDFAEHKVTFIELGADRCIPCRAMQPIMKEIAEGYTGIIQVVFYDVWKNPEPARKYKVQLIPTQVFVDRNGKEIFRHVGFFSKEEILKALKDKGIL